MKFSKNFDRDYDFYCNSIGIFDFCGTLEPTFKAELHGHRSAKECFYFIESEGKNYPCSEPVLLNDLLLTKAAVNFQIKQWAEARADGTLPLVEFSKKLAYQKYGVTVADFKALEWINGCPVYYDDISTQYNLPDWVLKAVENQKHKFYKKLQ